MAHLGENRWGHTPEQLDENTPPDAERKGFSDPGRPDRLVVDGDQIRDFVDAVFRYASPGLFISLRILDRRAAAIAEAAQGAPDDLLSTRAVAEWLGVSVQFLEVGRHRGYGPKFVRIGPARIRYRRAEILAWLEERTFASTSQAGVWSATTRRRTRRSTAAEGSTRSGS